MRRAAVPLAAALLLGGCCALPRLAPLPRVAGPPAPAERVAAVLARLRSAQAGIRTLKVVHRITLVSRQGGSTGALSGLLAVRRPDAYRLRVLGPAGLTALDLAWRAGRFVLEVPPRGVRLEGDERTPRKRLHGVPVDGLARAFLGTFEASRAALVEDHRRGLSRLTLEEPGGARRLLFLSADGAVRVDARFEQGRETLRLTSSEHRTVAGARLPHHVVCDMPREGLSARIEIERYDVNPSLPAAAFARP